MLTTIISVLLIGFLLLVLIALVIKIKMAFYYDVKYQQERWKQYKEDRRLDREKAREDKDCKRRNAWDTRDDAEYAKIWNEYQQKMIEKQKREQAASY